IPESDKLTNLVFMGMGEPLDNFDEVKKALEILTAPWGYGWSPKRITVSSIGVRQGLLRLLDETDVHIAISLHSPFPSERLEIMPVEKAFPMTEFLDLLRQYDFSKQRRLSIEYIVFNGYNDSMRHADELARVLKGLDARVNLIRFHAIPDVDLKSSDGKTMVAFRDRLNSKGVVSTIRTSRGEDIFAACGMLSTEKSKK
ncbi:MAG: radical SAM protein, partial [Bacteroidales bacterium]